MEEFIKKKPTVKQIPIYRIEQQPRQKLKSVGAVYYNFFAKNIALYQKLYL